jgi:predicted nucleic acid-binding protein
MSGEVFFDTNVLLYLLSADTRKADRSESLLTKGGVVSVQVLNEFASVASKKFKLTWPVLREALSAIRANAIVVPLTIETHDRGLELAAVRGFTLYDSMIVAAAERAGCRILYSENMQDRRAIDRLTIRNPYKPA